MTAYNNDYELLDFGACRRLERFGPIVLDRPAPAAESALKLQPELWRNVTARYEGSRAGEGDWVPAASVWVPRNWQFAHAGAAQFRLQLGALASGQVGVFPEQCANWDWLARQVAKSRNTLNRSPRVLNLFAYTGGSTLAAAAAGAVVAHVDAARSSVERGRENAALSRLADHPIRWIVEDALKFCRRQVKRGNKYDGIVLDPPSYGHGPKGEEWRIDRHLLPLIRLCGELTADERAFVLVTCHTPGIGPAELAAYLADGIFGSCGQSLDSGTLFVEATDGRKLPSGVYARWPKTT
jgi:23S rRNA (cytosine1962-C5)-methyltransferase